MILVLGKNGQVATALRQIMPQAQYLGSDEANFLQPDSVIAKLNELKPQIIINAAAYTMVDKAETEREAAHTINAITPGKIAEWCKAHNCLLIHYSTDYVFDGSGDRPWVESDHTNPVNYYGQSKLEGEQAIQKSGCLFYIFRVSWVYSPWGNNFKKTILRLASEREELKIVADQWGAPTKAEDIAAETKKVVELYLNKSARPYGLYHWRFNDYMTWHQFAVSIVQEARLAGTDLKVKNILPIPTEAFPTPAKRPKNSRLGTTR